MSDYDNPNTPDNDAKLWDLPFVDDPQQDKRDRTTNALNRRSDWVYEPPEEEEQITLPTLEEIEAIRQAARDEGYAEGKQAGFEEGQTQGLEQGHAEGLKTGHEEGLAQGLEEAREQVETQIQQWQSLTETLHDPLSQLTVESREQLARLAVALARAVIRSEVQTTDTVIMQALSEGIKALPVTENQYQIQLHPEDVALVTSHFTEQTIAEKGWKLVEVPGMARGGCDIITSQNAVDVTIERRCRDILDKFLLEQGLSGE